MIKTFDDMQVSNERPWLSYAVFGGTAIGFVGALIAVALDRSAVPGAEFARLLPVVMVPWVFFCGSKLLAQEKRQRIQYRAYLGSHALNALKLAASSPELDERTKGEVMTYLNDKHPGWSMG